MNVKVTLGKTLNAFQEKDNENVTKISRLEGIVFEKEKEIETPVDTLRWDYYNYILSHPITEWRIPTCVLYAGKDNLQPRDSIEACCKKFGCALTVSEESEHPFMAEGDEKILEKWYEENI